VRISGKTGGALEVEVTYWCQNIIWGSGDTGLPLGVTFPTDPGIADPTNVPFYFSQESVQIPTATPQVQALTFTGTITNNLQRVPQFNTDVIRSIPTLTRKADGTITATFATMSDVPNESNVPYAYTAVRTTPYVDTETAPSGLAQQAITLKLGYKSSTATTYYLTYTGAVLPKIDLTLPIADLVAVELPWTATGATVHT
jgi:hypothetical protein